MNNILDKIRQIKSLITSYNYEPSSAINENSLNPFIKEYEIFFKENIDSEFIDFLMISNGLEFNGYRIFSSANYSIKNVPYGIFENNELFYEQDEEDKKYILFAVSGSDLFVFNKEEKKYQLLDRYSGDVYKEYDSFNDMLLYILKLMLYEEVD